MRKRRYAEQDHPPEDRLAFAVGVSPKRSTLQIKRTEVGKVTVTSSDCGK